MMARGLLRRHGRSSLLTAGARWLSLLMFGWLTERRRARLLEEPFPETWDAHIDDNVALVKRLDDEQRQRLRELVQVFAAEKHWEGCGGLELTDEMKPTIAAQASTPACCCAVITRRPVWKNPTRAISTSSAAIASNHQTSVSTAIAITGPATNSPMIAIVETSGLIE